MTFGNELEGRLKKSLKWKEGVVLDLEQQSKLEEMFNDRMRAWKEGIHRALSAAGVPQDMVNEIPVVPAGIDIEPRLPGHEYWLSQLWFALLNNTKQHCQLKLLTLNKDRVKQESDATPKDFKKEGHLQPIVFVKRLTILGMKQVFRGGGMLVGISAAAILTIAAEVAVTAVVGSREGKAVASAMAKIAGPIGQDAGALFGLCLHSYVFEQGEKPDNSDD